MPIYRILEIIWIFTVVSNGGKVHKLNSNEFLNYVGQFQISIQASKEFLYPSAR